MRTTGLMVLGLAVLLGQLAPCMAQSPPEGSAVATHAAKETGRVGSLSPGEARRAERARARATAKAAAPSPGQAAQVEKTAPSPLPKPAANASPPNRLARIAPADNKIAPAGKTLATAARRADRHVVAERHPRRPLKRAYASYPRRTPRVGDVVPYGVPLYPLPPLGAPDGPDPGDLGAADGPAGVDDR